MGRRWGLAAVVAMVAAAAVAVVAVVALVAGLSPADDEPGGGTTTGVVSRVVDGDTIEVDGVGRVRLIGIDTPERGECGFDEASDRLAALVLGEQVTLRAGAGDDTDRYGRLLRYVEVAGTDAAVTLLEQGRAVARYDSRDGYGEHPREQQYRAVAAAAPQPCAAPGGT